MGERTPGWYPDPQGNPRLERWWGPEAWSSQTRPSPSAERESGQRRTATILALVLGTVVIVGGISFALATGDDEGSTPNAVATSQPTADRPAATTTDSPVRSRLDQLLAEKACKKSVEQQLKDPESADYRGLRVVDQTGTSWTIAGQVNANNSFGGKVGFSDFTCRAVVNSDQSSSATALLN